MAEFPSSRPLSLAAHWRLLCSAPTAWRLLALLTGLLLFVPLAGWSLYDDWSEFNQSLREQNLRARAALLERLQDSQALLESAGELLERQPDGADALIPPLARHALPRQPQLHFIGYQPLVRAEQRAAFELATARKLGRSYQIRDYRHALGSGWTNGISWRAAARRPLHLPLSMAVPQPPWQVMGLDMLADPVLSASVHQALSQGQAATPPLQLVSPSAGIGIGLMRAIYRNATPDALLRREQAQGIVLQVISLRRLLDDLPLPPDAQARLLRSDGAPLSHDETVLPGKSPPAAAMQDGQVLAWDALPLNHPFLPYLLEITRPMTPAAIRPAPLLLAGALSLLFAYLVLLIQALLLRQRQIEDLARADVLREREHAEVALGGIGDAVISCDLHLTIRYLNPAAETLLGIGNEMAQQRPLQQVLTLHYEFSRQLEEDPLSRALRTRQAVALAPNCYLRRPDGSRLLVEGSVAPLLDAQRQPLGIVLALHDTAPLRERMMAALAASENRLRQHEVELARVIRINTLGEMASGIAHEVNQPLSAIMSYCQAAQNLLEDEDADPALLHRALASAVRQAERAGQIIHRLRDFVSKKNQQLDAVNLQQVALDTLALLDYELKAHDIHVEHDFPRSPLLVYADKIQLEQVVLNLVRNAVEAMESVAPWGRLLLSLHTEGLMARLSVCDNGSGIPPEQLDQLFDPFFSTKQGGMGLGLTICQTAVESFGGRLQARNRPEGGAEFRVELPLMTRSPATDTTGAEACCKT